MADNTLPIAIRTANEKVRTAADSIESCYETLKRLQNEYAAVNGDTIFPATADNIADGSETDGRKRVTNNQIRGLKTLTDAIVTFLEGGTPSRISQIKQISVNGLARF